MKLLDTLIKKRDHHLALAGKFQELISVIEGDDDLVKAVHGTKVAMMRRAQALASGNGNGNGHALADAFGVTEEKPKRTMHSPAERKRMAARMRKLWKEKRSVMMKGVRRGHKKGVAARLRNKAAREAAAATAP